METKHPLKSKTINAGLAGIVTGIALLFGPTEMKPAKTIDGLGAPQSSNKNQIAGIAAIGSGLLAIKGRYDASTSIRRKGQKR